MLHSTRFRIVGFLDQAWKWHGRWQNTYFREEDCYETDHLPTQDMLREYAKQRGYWTKKDLDLKDVRFTGSILEQLKTLQRCEPLYLTTDDGLEFVNCSTCWPHKHEPIIDNMRG